MLREGRVQVSMAEVGEMLPHYFKEVDGRWYLRGEAVVGGNVFDLKSDAGALDLAERRAGRRAADDRRADPPVATGDRAAGR